MHLFPQFYSLLTWEEGASFSAKVVDLCNKRNVNLMYTTVCAFVIIVFSLSGHLAKCCPAWTFVVVCFLLVT